MPEEPIRIKRYPNRRFYASHTSKYVSLAEIEQFIRAGQTVEIRDSQTGDDLTRSVIVQIIAERHPEKMAMFPTAMLHSILRANDLVSDFLREYFRNSLAYLEYFQQHGSSAPLAQPMHWMKAWLDGWSVQPGAQPKPNETPVDANQFAQRIAELEQRISELEEEKKSR